MSYEVIVSPTAARQLSERLPEAVAAACWELLAGPLAENPRRVGSRLGDPFAGQWGARRGPYRVRYRIDEDNLRVFVVAIEHRRDAYRA